MCDSSFWAGQFLGFAFGAFAGLLVAFALDYLLRPSPTIELQPGISPPDATSPHGWVHVKVTNQRRGPSEALAPNPRPAFACTATIQAFYPSGNQVTPAIAARWDSQPEPESDSDNARIIAGRRADIYPHDPQTIPVLAKFDGDPNCWLFSNESYKWGFRHPDWRLGPGRYRIRVIVRYEFGLTEPFDFWIDNAGSRRDDLQISTRARS